MTHALLVFIYIAIGFFLGMLFSAIGIANSARGDIYIDPTEEHGTIIEYNSKKDLEKSRQESFVVFKNGGIYGR